MSTLTIVYLGWICNAVMLLLSLILILILTIIARVNDPIGTLEFHNWVKQANENIEMLFINPNSFRQGVGQALTHDFENRSRKTHRPAEITLRQSSQIGPEPMPY